MRKAADRTVVADHIKKLQEAQAERFRRLAAHAERLGHYSDARHYATAAQTLDINSGMEEWRRRMEQNEGTTRHSRFFGPKSQQTAVQPKNDKPEIHQTPDPEEINKRLRETGTPVSY